MHRPWWCAALVFVLYCPLAGQSIVPVILPRNIEGTNGTNANRVPFAFRARLEGLRAGAVYRYMNLVVVSADAPATNGAGNCVYVSVEGDFLRSSGPSLSTAGAYGEFATDTSGAFEGWFVTEPTGNARFTSGNSVFVRVILNDGQGGSSAALRLTTSDSIHVLKFDTTAGGGTAVRGTSAGIPKDLVFLYDDVEGDGRPIAGTFVESDGSENTVANGYAAFYGNRVNGIAGAFGTILPNTLPSGVRRIECRSRNAGGVVAVLTDADGVWPTGGSTVDPRGGGAEIVLGDLALPVDIVWICARVEPGPVTRLQWMTSSETRNFGFFVQRRSDGETAWSELPGSFCAGHGTTVDPHQYEYVDRTGGGADRSYRLRQVDLDGASRFSEVIRVQVTTVVEAEGSGAGVSLQCWGGGMSGVTFGLRLPVGQAGMVEFGLVRLRVFDLLGREVAVLVNETRPPGEYVSHLDARTLPSGTYFCRLEAGSIVRAVKFCLVK